MLLKKSAFSNCTFGFWLINVCGLCLCFFGIANWIQAVQELFAFCIYSHLLKSPTSEEMKGSQKMCNITPFPFLSRRNRISQLAGYTDSQLQLFLTLRHPKYSYSWMKDGFVAWKKRTWIPHQKLEAQSREICEQGAFNEAAALTISTHMPSH